jgi:hypothetical protein
MKLESFEMAIIMHVFAVTLACNGKAVRQHTYVSVTPTKKSIELYLWELLKK